MSDFPSFSPEFFITPAAHDLPPRVRVLTTTRVLPNASNEMLEAAVSAMSVQAQPLLHLPPRGGGCPEGAGEGGGIQFSLLPHPSPASGRGVTRQTFVARHNEPSQECVHLHQNCSSDVCWPLTPHPKGAALEFAFAQRRHGLHHFLPTPPLWLQQVHGIDAVKVDCGASVAVMRQRPPVADAAVTCVPDVVLAVLTADCLPVVIACENGSALAVVHAGWRGLTNGVLENAVRCMAAVSSSPATPLTAWLGPAIGPAAFEVGEEVYTAFDAAHDGEAASCFISTCVSGKWHADLVALARLRLRRLGILKVSGGTWCTYSDAQRFFSYRRQRDEGRMATLAWVEGDKSVPSLKP